MVHIQRRRHGFTLIELLVVIAIIAILAAILFPVFARARAKARQTACLSNVKQISLALMMYAQDHDETCPRTGGAWWEPLMPYVKNAQVFRTPAYSDDATASSDYVINGLILHGETIASFERPADQIAIVVRAPGSASLGYHPWPNDYNPGPPTWDDLSLYVGGSGASWFTARIGHDVHNDGSNYGFMDGHAKWYRWEQTLEPQLPGLHNIDRTIPGWHH
ncbi:MAG: prepilin-type N-terminal cleavage/methylation domain-containing protein [candidate division WS1 bacterium]|nr:prepilin-type N-terminal cleavage/methylation domain-containing protein [candidate division WS1 bacterium]